MLDIESEQNRCGDFIDILPPRAGRSDEFFADFSLGYRYGVSNINHGYMNQDFVWCTASPNRCINFISSSSRGP